MSSAAALTFSGTVYFALLDGTKSIVSGTGFRKAGEVYPWTIQPSTTQATKSSAMRETAGQTKHTKTSIDEITGSATFHEMFAAVYAWALAGEEVEMTEQAGTATAEPITLILDQWVRLVHRNVSTVVITGGTVNVDYQVNAALGMVKLISTTNLSEGAETVDYAYAAEAGYQVKIGTNAQIRVAVLIDGENLESGEAIDAEFYSVVLSPNSELPLISSPDDDFNDMGFDLTYETPDGKTTPGVINGIPLQYYMG